MNKKQQLILALTLAITGKDNCPKTKHCEEIAEALCVGMSRSEIETCKALAVINANKTLEQAVDDN